MNIWKAKAQNGRLVIQPREQSPRERILNFERALAQQEGATLGDSPKCPLQHIHIDGVYVRTIFIPAGTLLTGKIHKHSHANILSQGEVWVYTEERGLELLKGPLTMQSPAGCKRIVLAVTDTTWTTIHATEETDLEKIEDYVIAKDFASYEDFQLETAKAQRSIQ